MRRTEQYARAHVATDGFTVERSRAEAGPAAAKPLAARVVDRVLEATVVGSFSKFGYQARSRLEHWTDLAPARDLSVVITGGTSGLGLETCVELARLGASVTFVARDRERASRARDLIARRSGHDGVRFVLADLADLESVRRLAADYLGQQAGLDVLTHNAGTLGRHYERAPGGTERTLATHVLGPFLLTGLLLPALSRRSGERDGPGRVLTVSSGGMYTQPFDLDRLEATPDGFDGVAAYARSKRAQVVLNRAWAARIDPGEVVFHAMHPGWADTPGLRSSLPGFARVSRPLLRTPAQGVDTLVWLTQAPEAAQGSGRFWLDRQPRSEHKLPWTRPTSPDRDQTLLWEWCAARAEWPDGHQAGVVTDLGSP
ncbi:MAG TPA: SDR family NAD(P)-dependent oxidoreductase [Mycobacteriales bacterium]|nr:SDR family NAD(P)-dependent oxidoreductase [Mycobacteriales bacterium]